MMTYSDTLPSTAMSVAGPVPVAALEALTEALVAENKLIGDLTDIMLKQRAAVGADDLQGSR